MASKIEKCQLSGTVMMSFKYTWIIKCFSSLDSRVGKFHECDVIELEENGLGWYMKIFPGGEKEDYKGYVSCFVYVFDAPESGVKSNYHLSLVNADDEVLFDGKPQEWVFFNTEGHGFSKTIATKDLKPKLINDTLVVILEKTYPITSVKDSVCVRRDAEIAPVIKLAEDLKKLWITKKHSDLIISVGDEDIPVHSSVLCARSQVFSAMFEHDTKEKTSRRVEVTDFEKVTMESFMEYIYSGSVREMNFDLALELLRASDKYEVSDLKSYCYSYLKSLVSDGNVCRVLLCADIHNAEKLRSHAIEHFCKNLSEENFESQRSTFKARPDLVCDMMEEMIKRYKILSPINDDDDNEMSD